MKIAFRFENGTSQLVLTAENAREKQCLDLCMDGKQDVRVKPTAKDCTIIEFSESKPKEAVADGAESPKVSATTDGEDGPKGAQ